MSRLRVIGNTTGATTPGLPAGWLPGDLAIVAATRSTSTTPPSLASGFTDFGNAGSVGGSGSIRCGYRWLTGSESDAGTWTNGTSCRCVVIRGADPAGIVATGVIAQTSASTTTRWPAVSGVAGDDDCDRLYLGYAWDAGSVTPSGTLAGSYGSLVAPPYIFHRAGPVTDWTEETTATDGGASWTYRHFSIALRSGSFPFINAAGYSFGTSLAGGVALTMPSPIAAGDLLLAFCANDNPGATDMAISGWTQIQQAATSGGLAKTAIFAKIAAGGDTATLTGASEDYVASVNAIKRHGVLSLVGDIKVATAAGGNSTGPDFPSLDAGVTRKWLWLGCGAIDSSNTTVSAWAPTNHTAVGKLTSAASTTAVIGNAIFRQSAAQTNDPGAMTISAAREWVMQQIAVPPVFTRPGGVLFWAFP